MGRFSIDPRLGRDSRLVTVLGLCQLRLMRDARWPWLLLVPQRADVSEMFDLTPLDQTMLTFETTTVARALKAATGCTKVNIGALGNQVRQFHVHLIARNEGDAAWPGPVWGVGEASPYAEADEKALITSLVNAL
ncbi:MAG TPA: HIT family protein [Pararhizobium sp.]|nr:HIT family protein [Pararhizobium sp.]